MYTVIVEGIQAYGYHGVSDDEQRLGHRYEVDLELDVEGSADVTDDIADSVDYGTVAMQVRDLVSRAQFRTVERLAHHVGEYLLKEHPRILGLEIVIRKLLPPADVIVDSTGIVLRLERP